jgi:hypothetical protein
MKKISHFIFLFLAIGIAGTVLFLSTWDMPAPVTEVEKVIPNDQFSN